MNMNDDQLKRIVAKVLETMKKSEENLRKSTPLEEEPKTLESGKAPRGTLVEDDVIPDILLDDYTSYLDFDNPVNGPEFLRIKKIFSLVCLI